MVAPPMLDQGDNGHGGDEHLWVSDFPGARQEFLGEGVGLAQLPAAREDVRHVRERDDADLTPTLSPVPLDQVAGDAKQLVPLPEIEQRPERLRFRPHDRKGEPAPLPELDSSPLHVQPLSRTLDHPYPLAEAYVGS